MNVVKRSVVGPSGLGRARALLVSGLALLPSSANEETDINKRSFIPERRMGSAMFTASTLYLIESIRILPRTSVKSRRKKTLECNTGNPIRIGIRRTILGLER